MREHAKNGALWTGWLCGQLFLVFVYPLCGAFAAGRSLTSLLEFPPYAVERQAPSFTPSAWVLLGCVGILGAAGWFVFRRRVPPGGSAEEAHVERRRFPAWGWAGVFWTAGAWFLAWTRLPWMEPVQTYTFVPLWIGYLWVANAWLAVRKGTCPLAATPGRYLGLFVASAGFWWVFEYLNRFTQNWQYTPIADLGAAEYALHGTLCFSTLLPSVYVTYLLVRSFPRIRGFLARGPSLPLGDTPRWRGVAAVAGAAGLAALGVWPRLFFPLVWVAPLFLLYAWPPPGRTWPLTGPLRRGDWTWAGSWALAALFCGFFWEMWNSYSALKWVYGVPHFHVLTVFEMPLLGYIGYLPFGVVCGLVVCAFRREAC